MTEHRAKYETRNPIVARLVGRFVQTMVDRVEALGPAEVVDLGCGEGYLARAILDARPGRGLLGIDRDPAAIVAAERRCPDARFELADLLDADPVAIRGDGEAEPGAGVGEARAEPTGSTVVICTEVLEHLKHPDALVERLALWSAGGTALVSVPWEPWFQVGSLLRGRYLTRLGNHPGHVQRFNAARFKKLLERSYREVEVETVLPWLLATCRNP